MAAWRRFRGIGMDSSTASRPARGGGPGVATAVTRWVQLAAAIITLGLGACTPLIAPYSLDAYKNATDLKAETQALIGESGEPYSQHTTDVKALSVKLDAAYEFANGIPKNQISATQWKILVDPNGNLIGGFLRTWSSQGTTSPAYQQEKKAQIGRAFDFIACLEVNKQQAKSCSSLGN
jgi:hypothetical protein